jgi:magnesium chelatase subunit D
MKLALLLNVVHPSLGGVLIRGHRGTAKSTAVRALPGLMPPVREVEGCPFHCDPDRPRLFCGTCARAAAEGNVPRSIERPRRLVNLPIGATEDRLLGSLDLEQALTQGKRRFEPGLLARANGAILYVDEVNLLSDHLVDLLLDVAGMGVNYVEREGISFQHPSRFVLVGTMNPEEGDLRPQLLDRFGLCVDVEGSRDPAERAEIARRRLSFESDPDAFIDGWAEQEADLAARIAEGMERVMQVEAPAELWELAARFSISYETEGHRSDLTMIKAATALAAFQGRLEVTTKDLVRAAEFALPHRAKKHGLRHGKVDRRKIEELAEQLEREANEQQAAPGGDVKKKLQAL